MEIYVDPRAGYKYSTWFLWGATCNIGKRNLKYSVNYFKDLSYSDRIDYEQGVPIIVRNKNKILKIFIDTEDKATIHTQRYDWCNIYAKVNVAFNDNIKYSKLMIIGPHFGLRNHNLLFTIFLAIKRYIIGRKGSRPLKDVLLDYLYTFIRRRTLQDYEKKYILKDNYIFHASTLWYNQFAETDTNMYRGEFLKACKKAGMKIDGGLFYLGGTDVLAEMPDYPKYLTLYKNFIYKKRISMDTYIKKTKESVLVFNTPSVCGCHGWKLAEYLCMGKAIISTPLTREMPGEGLIHGESIHFVYKPEEIYDAVLKIKNDSIYRLKLEKGAREYYEKWLAPKVVIKRLIESASEI